MYQYLSAIAKAKGTASQWKEVDLNQVTFEEIQKTYSKVIFTLENPFLAGERFVTLDQMMSVGVNMSLTVEQFLSVNDNTALPDSTIPFEVQQKTVTYRDAWRAGYKVHYITPGGTAGSNQVISDRVNLLLEREGTSYEDLYNNCLFTVNGLFHLSDYNSNGLHIIEGGRSVQHANQNKIGILNFTEIGNVQEVPITSAMISKGLDTEIPYSKATYVKLGQSLAGKTPLVVIGGYLHILDDVYQVVNEEEGIIKITLDHVNLMHRLFESRKLITTATLALSSHQMNSSLIAPSELYSDAVIESYLTLPQSFVVLVDAESLYVKPHPLEHSHINGIYYTSRDPLFPVRSRTGIFPEYWVREEDDKYVLSMVDGLSRNYEFETTPWRESPYVSPSLESNDPYDFVKADLLEIGEESIVDLV